MLEELVEHIGTCTIHVLPEPLDPLVLDALPSNEGSTTRASMGDHEGSNFCVFQTFIRSHSGRYTILPVMKAFVIVVARFLVDTFRKTHSLEYPSIPPWRTMPHLKINNMALK
ncbi:hypothetical protein DPMN_036098 [Dreissena polymorpha]|uniref:Uncharacterized protein n=1 Tax=Dreissena polymorpha TaxID=45954 RepID=A0A9D4MAW8_DREPO|nr:hypothetical protein DPMN_036098 [Dreissena polymorpha]